MSYRVIRASEIGDYAYCRRSWWLKRAAGHVLHETREVQEGALYHRDKVKAQWQAAVGRRIAVFLIFLSLLILTVWMVQL